MPISGGGGRGTIFTPYTYATNLPAGTDFIPAVNIIIFSAALFMSAQSLDILYLNEIVKSGTNLGATEQGYIGGLACDGVQWRYHNTDVAVHLLHLEGYLRG